MVAMVWNSGIPFAGLASGGDGGLGHELALDEHVVRTGGAHAERAPGVEHLDLRRVHRDGEMQDHRSPSPSRMAPVISRSPAGAPEANSLRAVMR